MKVNTNILSVYLLKIDSTGHTDSITILSQDRNMSSAMIIGSKEVSSIVSGIVEGFILRRNIFN